MRGTTTRYASTRSLNALRFAPPYSGPDNRGTLILRSDGRGSRALVVSIDRGQFRCSGDQCEVSLRFDDGDVVDLMAGRSSDGDNGVLFLPYRDLVPLLAKAHRLFVEATFYQEGTRQLEFRVSGLRWSDIPDPEAEKPPTAEYLRRYVEVSKQCGDDTTSTEVQACMRALARCDASSAKDAQRLEACMAR